MAISEGTLLRLIVTFLMPSDSVAQNVFNVILSTAGSSSDEDDVLTDLKTWATDMYAHLTGSIADDVAGDLVEMYEYDTGDDDWDKVNFDTFTYSPTNTNDMLPHGAAGLVRMPTTDPDVIGRKFVAGIAENAQSESDWNASTLSNLSDFASEWATPFVGAATGASFTPVVWSPTKSAGFPTSGSVVVSGLVAYQRRRKPGVGE